MARFESELADIPNRAARGAAWFDQHEPGWHEKINTGELDISSDCNCVVGQLYGSFVDYVSRLFFWQRKQVEHGVLVPALGMNLRQLDQYYTALTEAWQHEISHRKAA